MYPEAMATHTEQISAKVDTSSSDIPNQPFREDSYSGSDSYYRGEKADTRPELNSEFTKVNPFQTLGVNLGATFDQVQAAWKEQVIALNNGGLTLENQERLKTVNAARDALLNEEHRTQLNQIWGPQTRTQAPTYQTKTPTQTRQPSSTSGTGRTHTYTPRHSTFYGFGPREYMAGFETDWQTTASRFPIFTRHFTTSTTKAELAPQVALVTLDQLTYAQLYRTIIIAFAVASILDRKVTSAELNRIALFTVLFERTIILSAGNSLRSKDLL